LFDNFNSAELAQRGLTLINNSADEILQATMEMYENLSGGGTKRDSEIENAIQRIRLYGQFASRGNFSNSWLRSNYKWFLRE
jgi:hypothetical protein